jgi:hypothetical protein
MNVFYRCEVASAKRNGHEIFKTKCGKGVEILVMLDRYGLPFSVSTHAADTHATELRPLLD